MAESSEISLYVRPKSCKFDESDLPVIQNLLALGYSEADVGMLLGYQGSNWKISAGKTLEEYREAIDNGLRMADAAMVENLCREAFGYEWEEVKTSYKAITDYNGETGEVETKMIPQGKTVTKKRQPGNSRLAELLATNRLPELFKRVSEVKKSELNAKITGEMSDDQIDKLVGRLLDAVEKKKIIEAVIVEETDEL